MRLCYVAMKWHFPQGGSNVGFNSAGISHFVGDTGLFREVVQNSLDAKDNRYDQVQVELKQIELQPDEWDSDGLHEAIELCLTSKWLNTKDGRERFQEASRLIEARTVTALSITDTNTTGASDDREQTNNSRGYANYSVTNVLEANNSAERTSRELTSEVSKWEGLTDSEGIAVQKSAKSGGSYGLGKHAPFSATPLRTVLYSTCYRNSRGELQSRFIGRSMLVTHYDRDSQQRSHHGYLGKDREPLRGNQIPPRFRVSQPGTRVIIPGWNSQMLSSTRVISSAEKNSTSKGSPSSKPSSKGNPCWENGALQVLAEHYFYALLKGHLKVTVLNTNANTIPRTVPNVNANMATNTQRNTTDTNAKHDTTHGDTLVLDADTLKAGGHMHQLLEEHESKVLPYVDVVLKPPSAATTIENIGDVKLYVDVGKQNGRRNIAFVRYPGVKIADNAKSMAEANPSIPYSWENFTAVVAVTPRNDSDWVVRSCESPSHDSLDTDRLNKPKRKQARQALKSLAEWVRNEIEKFASRPDDTCIFEADELIHYGLTVEPPTDDTHQSNSRSNGGDSKAAGHTGRQLRLLQTRTIKTAPKIWDIEHDTSPDTAHDASELEPISEESREGDKEDSGEHAPTGEGSGARVAPDNMPTSKPHTIKQVPPPVASYIPFSHPCSILTVKLIATEFLYI